MKANLKKTFQDISNTWTQLLGKAEKEFGDLHLTVSDKHFIYAMLVLLQEQCGSNNCHWTVDKIKLPSMEPLSWSVEQEKYSVPLMLLMEDFEDDSDEDSSGGERRESDENAQGEEEEEEEDAEEEEQGEEEQEEERGNVVMNSISTNNHKHIEVRLRKNKYSEHTEQTINSTI